MATSCGWKRVCNPLGVATLGFGVAMVVSMVTLYFSLRAIGTNLDNLDRSIRLRLGEKSIEEQKFADSIGGQVVLQFTGALIAPFVAMLFSGFIYLSHQAQLDKLAGGSVGGEREPLPGQFGAEDTAIGTDDPAIGTTQIATGPTPLESNATVTRSTIVTNNILMTGNNGTTQISTNAGDNNITEATRDGTQMLNIQASNASRQ